MMAEYTLHFLGPTGTFTHQAAIEAAKTIRPSGASVTLTPEPDVPTILDAVQRRGDWGIIAWENNVEGYVVPNLDALIDADNVVGFARVGVNVSFDAFTLPGTSLAIRTGWRNAAVSRPTISCSSCRHRRMVPPAETLSPARWRSDRASAAICTI